MVDAVASSDEQAVNSSNALITEGNCVFTSAHNNDEPVSPNSVHNHEVNYHANTGIQKKWFYMRASYGRELKAESYLNAIGIETYCPQQINQSNKDNEPKEKQSSVIPNSLFVYSDEKTLKDIIGKGNMSFFHHYYRTIDGNRQPLIIPDDQMEQFRKWVEANNADKYFRPEPFTLFEGALVRVTQGTFAGFVGHVVKIKGYKRVGVNIDNIGFIATSYIPRSYLEVVEESAEG